MSAPYEIIAAPFTAYLAAANTAKPNVDTTPPVAWTKLGANGADNYDEDGVHITHDQNVEMFRGLGRTGAMKVWRTEEMVSVEFTVYDLTSDQYAKMLNNQTVTTVAAASGIPGAKKFNLNAGYDVTLVALLLRGGYSPYGDSWNTQYWLPVCWQDGNPEPTHKKGEPAGLKLSYKTIQDSSNGFGLYEAQNATAL